MEKLAPPVRVAPTLQDTWLLGGVLASAGLCGCQTNIGGQTLPSGYYLRDDVQYFPAGPEFLLPETQRAMKDHNAQQAAAAEGMQPAP